MPRTFVFPKALIFLGFFLTASAGSGAENSPRSVVEDFHASLLAVMKDAETLGARGRYDRLAAPIERAFHLRLTIRVASGSSWRRASRDQRTRLLEAFKRMSVSSYASQFDGYSGQAFETVGETRGPSRTILVETRIIRPGEDSVDLTYVVKKIAEGWRIVDVLLDNDISQLAVRRSEYRRLLKGSGVEGLIAALNRKANSLIAE